MTHAHDSYARTTDRIAELAHIVLHGGRLSRNEGLELAAVTGDAVYDLFHWANKIRIQHCGRAVKFCSIVAAKVGACSEDCGFCSQSAKHHTHVAPAKLDVPEMIGAMDQALALGSNSFGIVNSGKGPTEKELAWLEPFYQAAAANGKIRPCATLGELTPDQAQRLKAMGVLRINHNLETSRRNFGNLIQTHTYDDRVRTIRIAKEAGLSVCSGGIFGMGETWEDRVDMALELRDLGAEVTPINFLNAIPGTVAYGRWPELTPMEALHIVALYRFLLPKNELKIAGGRDKILRDLVSWVFFAGASSFMIGNYLTTFGRPAEQDHQMLRDLGLPYVTFDEVEHEAPPESVSLAAGLTSVGASVRASGGGGVSLPVVSAPYA